MSISSEFRYSPDSDAKMKFLLALFTVTCAVFAAYADNVALFDLVDVVAELSTEYPDFITESPQDESELNWQDDHGELEYKRERRFFGFDLRQGTSNAVLFYFPSMSTEQALGVIYAAWPSI
ncbi:hypothetical protein QAD02_022942 [Eretmocerus hayati]|uniref:Uncharacterized protein n=1 Tax=Eretmocerus hayati TaxID=131215 RepID=A0ACC2PW18_9HYME|nr:hypothetical protein QAD02_022942 [Eretmocerus hayati]